MFYSHSQAREKLPRKRRRVLPVEQVCIYSLLNKCIRFDFKYDDTLKLLRILQMEVPSVEMLLLMRLLIIQVNFNITGKLIKKNKF